MISPLIDLSKIGWIDKPSREANASRKIRDSHCKRNQAIRTSVLRTVLRTVLRSNLNVLGRQMETSPLGHSLACTALFPPIGPVVRFGGMMAFIGMLGLFLLHKNNTTPD